jgi:hypothetical protein
MVYKESDEPPRKLASAGAERHIRRKVAMKGAEMCAVFVKKGKAVSLFYQNSLPSGGGNCEDGCG